jgi:allantoinase
MPYEYSPIVGRKKLVWPNDAKLAVITIVAMEFNGGPVIQEQRISGPRIERSDGLQIGDADIPNYTWREYSPRAGVWNIMKVLDKHDVRATAVLETEFARRYPIVIEEAKKRNWELETHSISQNERASIYQDDPEKERELIRKSMKLHEELTGLKPLTYMSPGSGSTTNTARLVCEEGGKFVFLMFNNDEQPYPIKFNGKSMISIPVCIGNNDFGSYIKNGFTGEQVFQSYKDTFDVLYKESEKTGKLMYIDICCHPYVGGQTYRMKTLDRIIEYMKSHKDVWFTTAAEVTDWYSKNYVL